MTPDQIVDQFQQILATMQRMIAASADLARRIDVLEQASGEISGRLTHIDGNIQLMLDTVQTQPESLLAAYQDLSERVRMAEAELRALKAERDGRQAEQAE